MTFNSQAEVVGGRWTPKKCALVDLPDIPVIPGLLEQRIGRLDRIGQTETIKIHVPYFEKTVQLEMIVWFEKVIRIVVFCFPRFGKTTKQARSSWKNNEKRMRRCSKLS